MIYDLKRYKTNIDVLYFKNKILKNEKKIIQKYPAKSWDLTLDFDGATLGYNSQTARSPHFNVLNTLGSIFLKKLQLKNLILILQRIRSNHYMFSAGQM